VNIAKQPRLLSAEPPAAGFRHPASGRLAEKVSLFLFVPDQQPRMPPAPDLAAPIADLLHLLRITSPIAAKTSRPRGS
jgi:hypothetical protein